MRSSMHWQAAWIAGLAVLAHGQVEAVDWWQTPSWAHPWQSSAWADAPLDPGLEDVGPIGTSLRQTTRNLHAPYAFSEVYRTANGLLMRRDGALEAIFPRSSYIATPDGVVPAIPPGTVFRIDSGDRDWSRVEPMPRPGVDLRVDRRAVARRVPVPRTHQDAPEIREAIGLSEAYRRQRVAALLMQALEASAR